MENKKIRVLFVSSGNSQKGISHLVKNQGESLNTYGVNVHFFTIKGKRITGYIKNIPKLRKELKNNNYDIIHAHYSKSGYVASLASLFMDIPVVCSLMGSDIQASKFEKLLLSFFHYYFWSKTIVKSDRMKRQIRFRKSIVVPNGVNMERFLPINQTEAQNIANFDKNVKNVIWVSYRQDAVKNFDLAKKAMGMIDKKCAKLNIISGVGHDDIPKYMYAADLLLLTSFSEGSPNVIKEAMACNCPIVSTDVGDVKEIISDVPGCYICTFNPTDVANKINNALHFNKRTKGREKIINNGLDEENISKKLLSCYRKILEERL